MQAKAKKTAYWLLKDLNKAVYQFNMIEEGDRIAVAVSGGKDSLTLLELLNFRLASAKENYEIVAVHVSGDANGPCPIHPPLEEWFESGGYPYVIEEFKLPANENIPLNCHRCAWNRRKQIFEVARRENCNVVALGHHADDLAQTTLMNLVFHGKVETMAPTADYFGGVFRLIRPMCFLSESDIQRFAKAIGFPEPPPLCPRSDQSQRHAVQKFIRDTQKQFPNTRHNILQAGLKHTLNGDEPN
jgi:tRNA(Ile)-lysidine synthase TilS/MesJ